MFRLPVQAGLVAIAAAWLAGRLILERRRRARLQSQAHTLAEVRFTDAADAPTVECGSCFGWPTVSLVFPNAETRLRLLEKETIARFQSQLEKIVLGIWPHRPHFDVRKALSVTSVPEREALVQRVQALRRALSKDA